MYWTNQEGIPGSTVKLNVSGVDGYLYESCPVGYTLHALGTTVYNGIIAVRFDAVVTRTTAAIPQGATGPTSPQGYVGTIGPPGVTASPDDTMIGRIATAAMAVERGADPVAAVAETDEEDVIENGVPEPRTGLFDEAYTYALSNKTCDMQFTGDNAFASNNDKEEFVEAIKESLGLALPSDKTIVFAYYGGRTPGVTVDSLSSSIRSKNIFTIFYLCSKDDLINSLEELRTNLFPWGGGPISSILRTNNKGIKEFMWLGKTLITCHENCLYIHYPMIARITDSRYHAMKTVLAMIARFYNSNYDKALEKYLEDTRPQLVDAMERIYKDYLGTGQRNEMANLHREIMGLRESADKFLSSHLQCIRDADKKAFVLEALQAKGESITPREEIEKQIAKLMKVKGLAGIKIKRDIISFSTNPIIVVIDPRQERTVRYRTVRFYLIGRVVVRINVSLGSISFSSITDKSNWNTYTHSHAAVHVFPDGHACFGNALNTINQLLKDKNIVGLVGTIINFLGTANPDDGLGREFKKWPCVSSLTYKNATPERIEEVKEQCILKYSQ